MDRKPRRFGTGDLMILIAALAIGIGSARTIWLGLVDGPRRDYWWHGTPIPLLLAIALAAWAVPMSLACLAFRLRQPRPPWRRVSIQPGTAALLACSLVIVVRVLEVVAAFITPRIEGLSQARAYHILFSDSSYLLLMQGWGGNGVISHLEPVACFGLIVVSFAWPCGYAVAAVWLVLAVSGRWRPEKTWIDRLGRLLGATWIVITILTALPIR